MYTGQIQPGETYDKLKKCITINIVDFETIPVDKIHTRYHIIEDETKYKLTEVLEIHYLELPKLEKAERLKDIDDPIIEWLEFIDSKSKERMKMLAEKNENIKIAYEILERASKSKKAKMIYEARQAEIMDQMTREKTAREEGIKQGIEKGIKRGKFDEKIEIAKKLLAKGMNTKSIEEITGLSASKIEKLMN